MEMQFKNQKFAQQYEKVTVAREAFEASVSGRDDEAELLDAAENAREAIRREFEAELGNLLEKYTARDAFHDRTPFNENAETDYITSVEFPDGGMIDLVYRVD